MINWKIPNDKIRLHDFNIRDIERPEFEKEGRKAKWLRLLFGSIFWITGIELMAMTVMQIPPLPSGIPNWVIGLVSIGSFCMNVIEDFAVCRFRYESAIPFSVYLTHPGEWFRGLKKP